MSRTYSTRTEAIQREIIEPLGGFVADFDVDAIADQLIVSAPGGEFHLDEGPNFWDVAAQHAIIGE